MYMHVYHWMTMTLSQQKLPHVGSAGVDLLLSYLDGQRPPSLLFHLLVLQELLCKIEISQQVLSLHEQSLEADLQVLDKARCAFKRAL